MINSNDKWVQQLNKKPTITSIKVKPSWAIYGSLPKQNLPGTISQVTSSLLK